MGSGHRKKEFLMKNLSKFFGIAVLALAFTLACTGCANETNGNGNNTNGRLTITGLGAYAGNYVFGMTEGSSDYLIAGDMDPETQSGIGCMISSGGSVTLKVWKSSNSGFVDYKGNDKNVPLTLRIMNSPELGAGNYVANISVNVDFTNGIGSLAYAFSLPQTTGLFTLTDLGSYNGKYAFLLGAGNQNGPFIYGFKDLSPDGSWKGFRIENSKAEIPLYYLNDAGDTQFKAFGQNGVPLTLQVFITGSEIVNYTNQNSFKGATLVTFMDSTSYSTPCSGIQFSNGKATESINSSIAITATIP
jgi:hypothetical protein